jgi:hypothetical protein
MRTTPGIEDLLQPLEEAIAQEFIPAITGREVSDEIRELLALPPRLGGLGIVLPTLKSAEEFEASKAITKALVETIKTKQKTYDDNVIAQQKAMKREVRQKRNLKKKKEAEDMKLKLPQHMKRNIIMAQEKGASSWLNVIPLKEHGFALHKGDFRDVLCLRYDWSPPRLPSQCACGQGFTVTHAMDCPSGGFPSRRHNMIRDLTGEMLSEVCHGVAIEPTLQPLNGEHLSYATANRDDNARSDLCAQGFWGKGNQRAFLTLGFAIPTFKVTAMPALMQSIADTREKSVANMKNESLKLKWGPSLPWCSRFLVEWANLLQLPTKDLLISFQQSARNCIV